MKFYMIISLILELRKPGYPADFYRKLALKIHEKFRKNSEKTGTACRGYDFARVRLD